MTENDSAPVTTLKPGKMVIGWFSFTGCEGCTILLSELLNKNFDAWKKLVEFQYIKTLKTKNVLGLMDVAFIEGAVSSPEQAEKIKKIRDLSKYVVTVGSCACTGRPSASRNDFSYDDLDYRILWYFSHFDYDKTVKSIEEVIKVDDKVPGCPMNSALFGKALEKYLKLFNLV